MAKAELTDTRVQGRLTPQQAATALGVSQATVYRYMSKGWLAYSKNNGVRTIAAHDLEMCKDRRTQAQLDDLARMRLQRRAAAHALHALYGKSITAPARDAFFRRFEQAVDPENVLPARERSRRAKQARKAYFTDLARRSSKARRKQVWLPS